MPHSDRHSASDLTRMAGRVHPIGVSVFSEMSRLAAEHNAVNLSQGFPDFAAPDWLKEAARHAIAADLNQYAPSQGSPRLRAAIADKTESMMGVRFDENHEIIDMEKLRHLANMVCSGGGELVTRFVEDAKAGRIPKC